MILIVLLLLVTCGCEIFYPCKGTNEHIFHDVDFSNRYFCYKSFGFDSTKYWFRNIVEMWLPGAIPPTLHSDTEFNWIRDTISSTGKFYISLIKTGFFHIDDYRDWPGDADKYMWLDRSDMTYIIRDRLDAHFGDWGGCCDSQKFCFRARASDKSFYVNPCSYTNYEAICKYQIPRCWAKEAYDVTVCSGKGTCEKDNYCKCEFGYTGDQCETTHTCGSTRQDAGGVCNNQGKCYSQDNCLCNEGYYGNECENTVTPVSDCTGSGEVSDGKFCYKRFSGLNNDSFAAEQFCQSWGGIYKGHSVTIRSYSEEQFIRQNFGQGYMISLYKSPANYDFTPCPLEKGYVWHSDYGDDSYVDSKGKGLRCNDPLGMCFGINDPYFWDDMTCDDTSLDILCKRSLRRCKGYLSTDPKACRKRGVCVAEDKCSCYDGYEGDDCQTFSCHGIAYNFYSFWNSPCSGRGKCIGPDSCTCDDNYGGEKCEITTCDGILATDTVNVCHGHGNCTAFDECTCDWNYGGEYCWSTYAPTGAFNNPLPTTTTTIKTWADRTDISHYSTYHTKWYQQQSIMFVNDYKVDTVQTSGTYNGLINQYEHDDQALKTWYPGKGHLFSLHSDEQYLWGNTKREYYNNAGGYGEDDQYSLWVGLTKVTSGPDWDTCSDFEGANQYWVGYKNTDSTSVGWIDRSSPNPPGSGNFYPRNRCNSQAACYRFYYQTGSTDNCNDQECYVPGLAIYHYILHRCNDIREDDPSVCNGRGFCWEHDKCTCKTKYGYVLPFCDTTMCHGTISNDIENVCGGHGACTALDRCECFDGWFGTKCDITSCFGKMTNETDGGGLNLKTCSGQGTCVGPDVCQCDNDNYFGDNCELTYCDFLRSTDSEVCTGHGTCSAFDTCTCNSTETEKFSGQFCQIFECFGIKTTDPKVCGGGGICINPDDCECYPNQYFGTKCNITKCFDIFSNDTDNVCNSKGECVLYNTCDCKDDMLPPYCNVTTCYDLLETDIGNVCNGKGLCKGYDNCVCTDSDYFGPKCDVTTCHGIHSNDTNVCWGKGNCVSKDTCTCFAGHYGDFCNQTSCGGVNNTGGAGVCFGRGSCENLDQCKCIQDYDPEYYCEFGLCFNESRKYPSKVCNGKGNCVDVNNCTCTTPGYKGLACFEYFGGGSVEYRYDFFSKVRKIIFPYVMWTNRINADYVNKKVDCLSTYFKRFLKDDVPGDIFGGNTSMTKCTIFGVSSRRYGGEDVLVTSEIALEIPNGAPFLTKGSTYKFEFFLQEPQVAGDFHTFSIDIDFDENNKVNGNLPFIDDNDDEATEDDDGGTVIIPTDQGDEDDGKESDSSSNVGAIVGGVTGGMAVLVICILLILCTLGFFCIVICGCCCLGVCMIAKRKGGIGGGGEDVTSFEMQFDVQK